MLEKLKGCIVIAVALALWPLGVQAQESDTAQASETITGAATISGTTTISGTVIAQPLSVEYSFPPLTRPRQELYPDPALSTPTQPDSADFYMQRWHPHPRYVNGSCAWQAQGPTEGRLISIDAICLSPSHRGLFRSVSLTATDRTGRPVGGTLMTYRNDVSVGVYPITQSPFSLTVDANEAFDRIGVYFRRPTTFDDVVISY